MQFLDLLMEVFTRADAPRTALAPLLNLKSSVLKREPKWFNVAENYLEATSKGLSAKVTATDCPTGCPTGCPLITVDCPLVAFRLPSDDHRLPSDDR